MNRRSFITLLGGAAAAWPLAARAQQGERMRRVGVFMNLAKDDPESKARLAALVEGLQQLGWSEGRNLRIDTRWGSGDANSFRRQAAELVTLAPDVMIASGATLVALQHVTRTVPIVFVNVTDPAGGGFVESLAQPGGNTTGFTPFEIGFSAKWLELLKEIAPGVTRVAVLRDPAIPSGVGQFTVIQTAATSLGVEAIPVSMRDAAGIEQAVAALAHSANGGLILTVSGLAYLHRDLIIALAARHKLPAVYADRPFAAGGGLISYGSDQVDGYRRAAGYVDRILKGEKPADLSVQAPTRYVLVINLKTAKALGIEVPPTLLARADEVIE